MPVSPGRTLTSGLTFWVAPPIGGPGDLLLDGGGGGIGFLLLEDGTTKLKLEP